MGVKGRPNTIVDIDVHLGQGRVAEVVGGQRWTSEGGLTRSAPGVHAMLLIVYLMLVCCSCLHELNERC
jgi:hypothetical protein